MGFGKHSQFLRFLCIWVFVLNTQFILQADESYFSTKVQPFLKKHCFDCHGEDKEKGDVRLDILKGDFTKGNESRIWVEVRNQITLGEMPPPKKSRPKISDSVEVTGWIATKLRALEKSRHQSNGQVLLRRLNRREYTRTVSDLFDMKFPSGESPMDFLPPDGSLEGFDKTSAALMMDPSLLSMYFDVARMLVDKIIVDGPPDFPTEKMRLEFEDIPNSNAIGYLVSRLGINPVENGLEIIEGNTRSYGMLRYPGRRDNNVAPKNGFYRFTIRAGGAQGANGDWPIMLVTHNHPDESMEKIMEMKVDAAWPQSKVFSVVIPRDTLGGEINVSMKNETRLYMSQRPGEDYFRRNRQLGSENNFAETIRLTGRKVAEGWGGDRSTPDPEKLDVTQFPRLYLDFLEVEGPLYDQWPPKSHTSILFRGPDAKPTNEYVVEIFSRYLPKVWRRPVDSSEIKSISDLVIQELEHGESFHESIRIGILAALVSPHFLYLAEPTDKNDSSLLTHYEVASRLSYLMWNSMPDDQLMKLAEAKRLHSPEVLRNEVDRMIQDQKSERFVQSFASQWLRIDSFRAFKPDLFLYREYDDGLGEAAVEEAFEFFRHVFYNNLSIQNFVDSEFVVINQRLAEHYQLPYQHEEGFYPVSLPEDSPRGGLLGMMGIHMAGADGNRTKPVSRAVYIREVLFNNPPDPPPPNAGEIEPNIKGEKLTVRERLLQHQEIETCAACHKNLDPYGLALENFNVIGLWRDFQDGENFRGSRRPKIEIKGTLPNGDKYKSFDEFKSHIQNQSDRFTKAMVEKLFVYALGRPVDPQDTLIIENIVTDLKVEGDSIADILKAIVVSQKFLSK